MGRTPVLDEGRPTVPPDPAIQFLEVATTPCTRTDRVPFVGCPRLEADELARLLLTAQAAAISVREVRETSGSPRPPDMKMRCVGGVLPRLKSESFSPLTQTAGGCS
jgi:hypothetical protein